MRTDRIMTGADVTRTARATVPERAFKLAFVVSCYVRESSGIAFVSDERLQIDMRVSRSTLTRTRKDLADAGWLAFRPGSRGRATEYQLLATKQAAMEDLRTADLDRLQENREMRGDARNWPIARSSTVSNSASELTRNRLDSASDLHRLCVSSDAPTPSLLPHWGLSIEEGHTHVSASTQARMHTREATFPLLPRIQSFAHARSALLRFLGDGDPQMGALVADAIGWARVDHFAHELTRRDLTSDDVDPLFAAAIDACPQMRDRLAAKTRRAVA